MPHPKTGQLDCLYDENLWPSHLERYIASTCELSDFILVLSVGLSDGLALGHVFQSTVIKSPGN